VIRRAEMRDLEEIAELATQLGYPTDVAAMRPRLEAALGANGTRAVFVVERDGRVRGWIDVAIIALLSNDAMAEIHGLVVDERERSAGFGALLVAAAEAWAAERGMRRMRVRSNVSRDRTRQFYERHGYVVTKTSSVFDKMLS
jgi:GNAT superfamily N-acetyltransferase